MWHSGNFTEPLKLSSSEIAFHWLQPHALQEHISGELVFSDHGPVDAAHVSDTFSVEEFELFNKSRANGP